MSMPSPIPSNIFSDGELTNEVKWYTRIFSVINSIISWGNAQPVIQHVLSTVTLNGASPSTGSCTVSFPASFAGVPEVTWDISPITSNTPVMWGTTAVSATGATVFVRMQTGTSTAVLAVRCIAVYG